MRVAGQVYQAQSGQLIQWHGFNDLVVVQVKNLQDREGAQFADVYDIVG